MLVLTYLNFFDYASPTFIFLSGWTLCSIIAYIYRNEWSLQVVALPCALMICGGAMVAFITEYLYRKNIVLSLKNTNIFCSKDLEISCPFGIPMCCLLFSCQK